MRSPCRQRALGSADRSPHPRCAATARPALRLRPPCRGTSKGQLANLSDQTPLKSHRKRPGILRIHEPSPTEVSHNSVSHNGLTHEYGARNFAQLREKRANNPAARTEHAHRTQQAAPQGVQTPAVGRYDLGGYPGSSEPGGMIASGRAVWTDHSPSAADRIAIPTPLRTGWETGATPGQPNRGLRPRPRIRRTPDTSVPTRRRAPVQASGKLQAAGRGGGQSARYQRGEHPGQHDVLDHRAVDPPGAAHNPHADHPAYQGL